MTDLQGHTIAISIASINRIGVGHDFSKPCKFDDTFLYKPHRMLTTSQMPASIHRRHPFSSASTSMARTSQ